MIDFSRYDPQQTFLVQGGEARFDELLATFILSNPLTQALSVPRFTVEHAATVASFALEGTGENRAFIVYFSAFSPEAAQALLKPLEEPASRTVLVFVTPYPYLVPQTVRSRTMIVEGGTRKAEGVKRKDIVAQIKKEAAEKDDEPAVRRARALNLLDELEQALANDRTAAQTVYEAKRMLFKANLPTKYVLDYITTVIRP